MIVNSDMLYKYHKIYFQFGSKVLVFSFVVAEHTVIQFVLTQYITYFIHLLIVSAGKSKYGIVALTHSGKPPFVWGYVLIDPIFVILALFF